MLWAFSFGLIRQELVGVPAPFVAAVRLGLAWLVMLPLWRPRSVSTRDHVALMAIGAVQYGVMYVLYIRAYAHLEGHEVALLTALTPLHVVFLSMLWTRRTSGIARALSAALLAAVGAAVLAWRLEADGVSSWLGIGLVQLANICFAWGQLAYAARFRGREVPQQARVFADLYLGGLLVALAASWTSLDSLPELTSRQIATLAYLGVIPSGLGFFLWNLGAARVSATALAVWNNVKVPLGVLASLLAFGEPVRAVPLALGSALIALALVIASRQPAAAD